MSRLPGTWLPGKKQVNTIYRVELYRGLGHVLAELSVTHRAVEPQGEWMLGIHHHRRGARCSQAPVAGRDKRQELIQALWKRRVKGAH